MARTMRLRFILALSWGAFTLAIGGTAWAQPSQVGQWDGPYSWPLVASHGAVLPDGRVLVWNDVSGTSARIWNPSTGTFSTVAAIQTTVGGSGQAVLATGDVAILGGHDATGAGIHDAHRYIPASGTWPTLGWLVTERDEPTALVCGDGRLLALGGDRIPGLPSDVPEIQELGSPWSGLSGAVLALPHTPWAFQLTDSTVLVAGPDRTSRRLAVSGTGMWSAVGDMTSNGREAGTAVLLPGAPDRVLAIGGRNPATSTCEILDFGASTSWEPTGSMARARRYHNATILADGSVLVTGGTLVDDELAYSVYSAERYVAQTGSWSTLASMTTPRRHGSIALLLPDARVLCAGGGDGTPGSESYSSAGIFEPPYLFAGTRPTITAAPASVTYGSGFTVDTPQASDIDAAWLVRAGSSARGFNSDQRAIALAYNVGSGHLDVVAPDDPFAAPPGTWMLFVVSGLGVPSVAALLRLEYGVPTPIPPHITTNPPANAIVAAPYSYLPEATGTTPMTWSLTSAPSWLHVSASTGALFGVPSSTGNVTVSLRATNAAGSETQTWTLPVVTTLTGVKTIVPLGDTWRYFKGTTSPPTTWADLGFDDSGWLSGPSGFGFGDNDDATVLSDMQWNYTTVYTRHSFQHYNVATVTKVSLLYQYDDGLAVYLNGTRIFSVNAPTPILNTSVASSSHEASVTLIRRDFTDAATRALLVEGTNVIAAVGLNVSLNSNDVTLKVVLELTGGTSGPVDVAPGEASLAAFLGAGPNPFTTGTRITFRLARPGSTRFEVYDVAGRLVRRVAAGLPLDPGMHALDWDGRDARGLQTPPGVYVYRLQAPDLDRTGKLVRGVR
jgi:Galactose oxidase-like, Early set domain/Putative Ig domain/FlgD Ig-like domain